MESERAEFGNLSLSPTQPLECMLITVRIFTCYVSHGQKMKQRHLLDAKLGQNLITSEEYDQMVRCFLPLLSYLARNSTRAL